MKKDIKMDPIITNSLVVGEWINVTDRHVRRMAEDKLINTVARGRYNLKDCVRKYCSYLQQQLSAKEPNKETQLSLDNEKVLHERAKREKAELQLKLMKGELHRSEDVEEIMTDMISNAKTKLLALPAKAAPMVMGYKDVSKVQNVLQKIIEDVLNELADYEPGLFVNDDVIQNSQDDE